MILENKLQIKNIFNTLLNISKKKRDYNFLLIILSYQENFSLLVLKQILNFFLFLIAIFSLMIKYLVKDIIKLIMISILFMEIHISLQGLIIWIWYQLDLHHFHFLEIHNINLNYLLIIIQEEVNSKLWLVKII